VDLPDVSIIPLLPPNLAKDKNVRAMCQAFDNELRRLIAEIPGIEIIPGLARKQITDNLLLDLLAWQFHCDFYRTDFSIEQKQEILLKSLDWHTRKGTPSVIEEIVSTVFSRAKVKEWFDYGGLPYRFIVGINEDIPDQEKKDSLIRAINRVKNTRSLLEKIISILYHEDELYAIDTVQIKPVRQDTDVFQRGLCCDGRFLCDQGKATMCDGSLKCDGSWNCEDFQLARGTVYDTVLASIFPNGAYRCDGSFDCSGYIKIYDPMAIAGPITPVDDFEDRLKMETELGLLEDQAGITPICDGTWNCDGNNLAPVIDAPMKLRIITRIRCDGSRTPSCSTCNGTWVCDGSHNCFDGWYCSGDLITEEAV
jgi:phage tail P2-like protein